MKPVDTIRVTSRVAVDLATAFEVFTEEVDAWWGRGPKFRIAPERQGTLRFEPGVGGRLVEVYDAEGNDLYEIGRILVWEPPHRLEFEFRPRAFGPDEVTRVAVRFEEEAGETRVTVEHSGWESIPPDHPARHGLVGPAFENLFGAWWAELILGWKRRAGTRS